MFLVFIAQFVVGWIIWWLPGFGLQLALYPKINALAAYKRWLLSLLLSTLIVPLVTFYFRYYLYSTFAIKNVALISLCISFPSLTYFAKKSDSKWLRYFFIKKYKYSLFFVGFLLIGLGISFYLLFIKSFTISGGDSPYYLFEATSVLQDGMQKTSTTYDRNIVLAGPAVISKLTNVSIAISIRLWLLQIALIAFLLIYSLTLTVVKNPVISYVNLALVFVSYSFHRFGLDIYANHAALIFMAGFYWWILEIAEKNVPLNFRSTAIAGLLAGSLFNLHGYVAFSSFIIFGITLLALAKKIITHFKKKKITLFLLTLTFFISWLSFSLPLSVNRWTVFKKLIVTPIVSPATTIVNDTKAEVPIINRTNVETSILDFPLRKSSYPQYYPPLMLFFGTVGLLNWLKRKNTKLQHSSKVTLVTMFLGYFLFTQQEYLGFNWVVERFVMALYIPILIASASGLWWIAQQTKLQNFFVIATGVIMVFFSINKTKTVWESYKPTIAKDRLHFYENLSKQVPNFKGTIYSLTKDPYWAPGLNPSLNIILVNDKLVCNQTLLENMLMENDAPEVSFPAKGFTSDNLVKADHLFSQHSSGEYLLLFDADFSCSKAYQFIKSYDIISRLHKLYLAKPITRANDSQTSEFN